MKIKKIKITTQNINMVYGLINKFFKSIECGEDYSCRKWDKQDGYSNTFFHSQIQLSDKQYIEFEYPVKMILLPGDSIHIDGNTLITHRRSLQYNNYTYSIYRLFRRKKSLIEKDNWD